MNQYEVLELTMSGMEPGEDWVNVDVNAVFEINGKEYKRKGYYAGNGLYKVNFLPQETGLLRYKVSGIAAAEGEEQVVPAVSGRHGLVRAAGTKFEYEDGTKYLPFGTTVYALLHQEREIVEQTMQSMKEAPFNKIRFCVFPKYFDFNRNEPKVFAFEKNEDGTWNVKHPCMEFWDELEYRISQFDKMDIQVDLILFHPYDHWGFMHLTREECFTYLEYIIRRLSAYPNLWWSLANEYDQMVDFDLKRWEDIAAFLSHQDGYGHLISNHNFVIPWDFSNPDITHVCLQASDAQEIPLLMKKYGKPVMYDEMGYEGNIPYGWGNLSAFEMVNRFWKTMCYGGYATHGETYMEKMNDDQVLWWSKGGTLKGESPARIRFLRSIMESFSEAPQVYQPEHGFHIESQEQLKEQLAKNIPGFSDNLVFICMAKMDDQQYKHMQKFFTQPILHVGDEGFLQYYGDMCTIYGSIELPENHKYMVEIIDVWEMTRTIAAEHVSGKVEIVLPGKPGIAILATME